jgi:outer membrane murein-binding lipoprotein Lpp
MGLPSPIMVPPKGTEEAPSPPVSGASSFAVLALMLLTLAVGKASRCDHLRIRDCMSDSKLTALVADVKKLNARVEALEKLLERILRQKPVSEKQLDIVLKSRGLTPPDARG